MPLLRNILQYDLITGVIGTLCVFALIEVLSAAGRLACVLSGQGLFLQAATAVGLALVLGVLPHLGTAVFGKLRIEIRLSSTAPAVRTMWC